MLFEHLRRRESHQALDSPRLLSHAAREPQEAILYQTVYLHLLNQTDIRPADPSLFFRKDCVGLYCIAWVAPVRVSPSPSLLIHSLFQWSALDIFTCG